MLIPKVGDWVTIEGFGSLDSEAGKVTWVDYEKELFRGEFFTEEMSEDDEGGIGEITAYFYEISEIIKDQTIINELEEEYKESKI